MYPSSAKISDLPCLALRTTPLHSQQSSRQAARIASASYVYDLALAFKTSSLEEAPWGCTGKKLALLLGKSSVPASCSYNSFCTRELAITKSQRRM